jgi:hypothetical protein
MDFYDVLDQVVAFLRRRRRVTCRTLKLQFQIEDEALETLKEQLLKAQRLAVDEAGEVLVWSGDHGPRTATRAASAPASAPASPLCVPSNVSSTSWSCRR